MSTPDLRLAVWVNPEDCCTSFRAVVSSCFRQAVSSEILVPVPVGAPAFHGSVHTWTRGGVLTFDMFRKEGLSARRFVETARGAGYV
jgi:hypothetical protein